MDKDAAKAGGISAAAPGKAIYTCPMHPEVQQDHSGDCLKCGMTLVLKTPTASPDHAISGIMVEP